MSRNSPTAEAIKVLMDMLDLRRNAYYISIYLLYSRITICICTGIYHIAKFKTRQFILGTDSPNLMLTKGSHYTVYIGKKFLLSERFNQDSLEFYLGKQRASGRVIILQYKSTPIILTFSDSKYTQLLNVPAKTGPSYMKARC